MSTLHPRLRAAVAVLGAGIMANAVSNALHTNGFQLHRYNRTLAAIDGPAVVCTTAAQAAASAAAVWSFVHDDKASRAVWFGPSGALRSARGALVIESSTLSTDYAEYWMAEAIRHGARPVLAPVTGSRPATVEGALLAFVSGADADVDAARQLLGTVAREVVRVDSARAVAEVKLLNNALNAIILTGLAEVLTAATTLGLDRDQLVDVWSRHTWAAPVTALYGSAMISGDHRLINCAVSVAAKDLRYARATFGTPLLTLVADRFDRAAAAGWGDHELSAIIEFCTETS
ncbi:NAD(P)-dependent oxidoreductase [Nocardia sp. NPDC051570]|uniref:NAD(P)-dependent oxidoreductase n=1 Tax=Nocardia sp. NPDC051570 TaxID=3364324 RepID=UPI0037884701